MRLPLLLALAGLLLVAPAAAARDATITSFDGTQIILSFHPAQAGKQAPTILQGHGWGGTRDTDPNSASSETTGNPGIGPLRKAGFNVLTWDSRGFGNSGGTVTVDSPEYEGRDVSALIDWLAQQPEARLDTAGDPRVGMTGVSYAGGIELVTAPTDKRIDAIAPIIAWHSLQTSLYKEDTVKGGWSSALYGLGMPSSKGRLDPHISSAFISGAATGKLSAEDRAWFVSRGPGDLVKQLTVPTLIVEGTADTLFTLREAIDNYAIVRANGVPAKMLWFCGGHGVCLTGSGPTGRVEASVVAWLKRYVAGDSSVDTGPRFEWLADDAKWRSAADYPLPEGAPLVASGSGTGAATHVFAQIVDEARGVVVGNQATPIPLTLDGRRHTVARPLEAIAASAPAGTRYTLQIIGGTQLYGPVRGAALIAFSAIRLELPTAAPGAVHGDPAGVR